MQPVLALCSYIIYIIIIINEQTDINSNYKLVVLKTKVERTNSTKPTKGQKSICQFVLLIREFKLKFSYF